MKIPSYQDIDHQQLLALMSHCRQAVPRRPRGEKKPIPEELKDGKYFERRKRNNLAAKKSRDQRKVIIINIIIIIIMTVKVRESQICQRATLLEKENAVLRAQVTSIILFYIIYIVINIIYIIYTIYIIYINIYMTRLGPSATRLVPCVPCCCSAGWRGGGS